MEYLGESGQGSRVQGFKGSRVQGFKEIIFIAGGLLVLFLGDL
jgi:hypothetical protein